MFKFSIDEKKCVKCGTCAAECPLLVIQFEKGKVPFVPAEKEEGCIKCQHCLAVCPVAALSVDGRDPEKSVRAGEGLPEAGQVEALIMNRRSYRRYVDENVDPETIGRLLNIAANAPTAKNSASVRFNVISDRAVMAKFGEKIYGGLSELAKQGKMPAGFEFFAGFVKVRDEKGVDVIFRGAPHLLVTSAPEDSAAPELDCFIAHSYFEIYAQSAGLGTLWNGIAKWACSLVPNVNDILGIPKNHKIGYFMVFGKPAMKYRRTVQRRAEDVNYVKM